MKRSAKRFSIAAPCHENWNLMIPVDKGRFCTNCEKTVIDFTRMSDSEVLKVMSAAKGTVCGRMTEDQLNRNLIPDRSPVPQFSLRALVLGTAITTFSALHSCSYAQGEVTQRQVKGEVAIERCVLPSAEDTLIPANRDAVFSGYIFDHLTNGFVSGVSVAIYDADDYLLCATLTGEKGGFDLPLDHHRAYRAELVRDGVVIREFYFREMSETAMITISLNEEPRIFLGMVIAPDF